MYRKTHFLIIAIIADKCNRLQKVLCSKSKTLIADLKFFHIANQYKSLSKSFSLINWQFYQQRTLFQVSLWDDTNSSLANATSSTLFITSSRTNWPTFLYTSCVLHVRNICISRGKFRYCLLGFYAESIVSHFKTCIIYVEKSFFFNKKNGQGRFFSLTPRDHQKKIKALALYALYNYDRVIYLMSNKSLWQLQWRERVLFFSWTGCIKRKSSVWYKWSSTLRWLLFIIFIRRRFDFNEFR